MTQAQSGEAEILKKAPSIPISIDDAYARQLLEKKIEQPILSNREKYLMGLLEQGISKNLTAAKEIFSNQTIDRCPLCFQAVSDDYKRSLIADIEKVLSKKVEDHCKKLRRLKFDGIDFDSKHYSKLTNEVRHCEEALAKLNQKIDHNNRCIDNKINNPYTPNKDYMDMHPELLLLENSLRELEDSRINYNKKISNEVLIKEKLHKLNDSIAFLDIESIVKDLDRCTAHKAQKERERNDLKKACHQTEWEIKTLNEQRKNVRIAQSLINKGLQYIFFQKNRLQLRCTEDVYEILSNGQSIAPSNLSVGERNAIALCYFFACVMENQDEQTFYDKDSCLIVIDDPISSFDMENKVGTLSYLRYNISKFKSCKKSLKILIMTHDLGVYYDLEDVLSDLGLREAQVAKFELCNHCLKEFETKHKRRDEYTILIQNIYEYALHGNNQLEIVIGNMMRQVLEAFSTFVYKKGITQLSTDERVLDLLNEYQPEYRDYFGNLMYRLVLHGGSHREKQVHTMKNMNFVDIISPEEKRRTAKDILCYLYLLNKEHLLSHLLYGIENPRDVRNEYEKNLDDWCKKIAN